MRQQTIIFNRGWIATLCFNRLFIDDRSCNRVECIAEPLQQQFRSSNPRASFIIYRAQQPAATGPSNSAINQNITPTFRPRSWRLIGRIWGCSAPSPGPSVDNMAWRWRCGGGQRSTPTSAQSWSRAAQPPQKQDSTLYSSLPPLLVSLVVQVGAVVSNY